eukprot:TRINITY_DN3696_c0_g2_i1.p1 TRINITY_DN3696_c0_g2~~TRINITY_DN3696_c0_g2_i1.p1  ORF type:complete len:250 (+),score=42.45 TRINITY_DN3696_c0_g2_i1:67-750(+)
MIPVQGFAEVPGDASSAAFFAGFGAPGFAAGSSPGSAEERVIAAAGVIAGFLAAAFVAVQVLLSPSWRELRHARRLASFVQAVLVLLVALSFPLSCALAAGAVGSDWWPQHAFQASLPPGWRGDGAQLGWAPGLEPADERFFLVQVHGSVLVLVLSWWTSCHMLVVPAALRQALQLPTGLGGDYAAAAESEARSPALGAPDANVLGAAATKCCRRRVAAADSATRPA